MDVDFVSEGWVAGRLFKVEKYPGLVLDPAGYKIFGEVLRICSESIVERVDRYEHAFPLIKSGFEYRRVLTAIDTPNGSINCWVYEYARPADGLSEIPTGRFLG